MALLSIIEFFDNSGEIIVSRIPPEGSGEFRLGSQLVVQESQHAVFFRDGQALDGFDAGRHTLSTQNLPLLGKIIGAPFGGVSPFRCYVYFISSKTFVSLGWGTQAPVLFRDKDFRMISLRAHGTFSIRVTKPRIFLNTLVGTRGIETTHGLHEFCRSAIISRLNESLSTVTESILDLPREYNNVALKTKELVSLDFEQYGIELVDLLIQAITPPKEVQKMINRATGVAAQDVEKYQAISAADALQDAAKNPSGLAGEGVGAGLGLAMGLGMAQQFGKDVTSNPNVQGQREAGEALSPEELKKKLEELKGLKDEGLISDADFEEQKRRLLSML